MPWIALVPDISGVCSIVGTFEITSKPTNTASTKIVISLIRVTAARSTSASRTRSLTICPSCVMQTAGHDLVLEVGLDTPFGGQVESRFATLFAYRRLAWKGIWLGRLSVPSIVTPLTHDDRSRLGQLAVAARLGRDVDDHRSGAHPAHHLVGDQLRRGPAGDCGSRDHAVGRRHTIGEQLTLAPLLFPPRAPSRTARSPPPSPSCWTSI